MTAITITAAEWASGWPGGTLWLVREGESCPLPDPGHCGSIPCHDEPPVEFVQACAPCENPTHRIGHKSGLPECRNPMELGPGMHVNTVSYVPCASCRIELVGPCEIDGCRWSPHRTLGYAYAIGQPLPIVNDTLGTGDCMIVDPDGDMWVLIDGVYDEPITAALAHYGPPESLVGRWAIQLRVVGS